MPTNRSELFARHGHDTKYARHALRLSVQGAELLSASRITLPVPQRQRDYRRGELAWAMPPRR